MELFSATDREKIEQVINLVKPLVERLVQAIHDNGISQNDLFAIYPVYFEYNRIQNELTRMVFYAENSERIQELQVKLAIARNELNQTERRTRCDLYDLFQPLLNSSDYVLMTSIVGKCLSVAFQLEVDQDFLESDIYNTKMQIWEALNIQQDTEADNNTSNKDEYDNEVAKYNKLIDMKRISLDVIWRELMLLFNQVPDDYKLVGEKFAELLFKGQPFEVLDGDNFRFNDKFLKAIFEAQKQQQLRIRVISILGPQNSGKSTLLNFMFGCDFSVSDGRCTRGIYGSFIKATGESAKDFDYLLVLDTEGLQSIEKSDREYDRKLILFVFAVSNIVILNTINQITEDFKATLEICVDSLSKIKLARVHQPTVFFVMNQKADPSMRTDKEAVNKIIANFKTNGLINQLRLDEKNFETLPSAFNTHTIEIKVPDNELRYCTTSPDFTKRVTLLVKTIIGQTRQTAKDEAFSSIVKWIEFSFLIFDVISNFPDLTYFNTIAARKQQKELQEFINGKLASQLSNVAKETFFEKELKTREASDNDEKAFSLINAFIFDIKTELMRDFDDYTNKHAVSAEIIRFQQEFLVSQLEQIKNSWGHELCIRMDESNLRREINTGEGKKLALYT